MSLAKKPSTALSQDAEVGVKWNRPAGMPRQPLAHLWVLVGRIIVDDGMDHFSPGDLLLDRVEEADELLVAMVLHVAANDGAIEDVEGCKQRGGAVTFVVVRHRPGAARLHRQPRLGTVERLDLAHMGIYGSRCSDQNYIVNFLSLLRIQGLSLFA